MNVIRTVMEKNFWSILIAIIGIIASWTILKTKVDYNGVELHKLQAKVEILEENDREGYDYLKEKIIRIETKLDILLGDWDNGKQN